jgi:hypothetical protein
VAPAPARLPVPARRPSRVQPGGIAVGAELG